jgi:hypothetical protein
MGKQKSDILSGMGSGFQILKALRDAGATDEDLRRIIAENSPFPKLIADLIVTKVAKPVASTFRDLLAACRQDWVSPDFNGANYPLEPTDPDEAEWEVYEYHFSETANGEDAFKNLEKLGYRLCGVRRAMEFIAAYPDLQLDHPLVITARWQDPRGYWCAPFADRGVGKRRLDLVYLARGFDPRYGWLVLRKRG